MRKSYILIYSDDAGSREQIKAWANTESMVLTWRYDLPHCFYLVSENSAQELSESLRGYTGQKGRFLVMETHDNRQGWLPPESWYLMRNKRRKPKET